MVNICVIEVARNIHPYWTGPRYRGRNSISRIEDATVTICWNSMTAVFFAMPLATSLNMAPRPLPLISNVCFFNHLNDDPLHLGHPPFKRMVLLHPAPALTPHAFCFFR